MTDFTFSRRHILALGGAIAFATLPLPAFAQSASQAERLVNSAVADINGIIASGASVGTMINRFAGVFRDYSDTAYVAAFALSTTTSKFKRSRVCPANPRSASTFMYQTGPASRNSSI